MAVYTTLSQTPTTNANGAELTLASRKALIGTTIPGSVPEKPVTISKPVATTVASKTTAPSGSTYSAPLSSAGNGMTAMDLVNKVMLERKDLNNYNTESWWQGAGLAARQTAYETINKIVSDPNTMAQYVKENGVQNLQNYSWWNNSPNKQQAWDLISAPSSQTPVAKVTTQPVATPVSNSATTPSTIPGTTAADRYTKNADGTYSLISGTSAGATTAGSNTGAAATSTPVIDPAAQAKAMGILQGYLNDGTIDSGTYEMFKKAVELWDPAKQIDFANILDTFQTIKNKDIDPYFKGQADLFINDLNNNRQYIQDTHALEVKQNTDQTAKNKETIQNDLASRGLLFSGQDVKQLGSEGTYATAGTPQAAQSAIPTIQPFAGTGELQKAAAVASSATDLRYQKSLKDLAQQAESTLGSEKAGGLMPGSTMVGGISGSLLDKQKSTQAAALTDIYNQQNANIEAQMPTKTLSA